MQDIVIFSYTRTDSPYSSTAFSLAQALANNRRVFLIEQPLTWKDVYRHWNSPTVQSRRHTFTGKAAFAEIKAYSKPLIIITLPPFLPVNFLPAGKLRDWINRFNEQQVWKALRMLNCHYGLRQWAFMNVYYPYLKFDFPTDLQPLVTIYYSIDDISQESYTARHGIAGERLLAQTSDLVCATGLALQRKMQSYNPRVFWLPNGADVALFNRSVTELFPRPADLPPPDKPCLGYVGNIDAARNDFALLAKLAARCSDMNLVLIGPLSSPREAQAAGLQRLPNVFFLGSKPMWVLPAYLQHMQCLLIPFLCNTLTKSIYPLKINEYLAAGKPVVTTPFSEDIQLFGEAVTLADSHEAFIAAVRRSVTDNSPEKVAQRTAIAAQNTWEARARQLETIVQEFLQQRTNGVS